MGGRRVRRPQPQKRRPGCLLQFVVAAIVAIAIGYFMGTFLFDYQTGHQTAEDSDLDYQQSSSEKLHITPKLLSDEGAQDQKTEGSARFPTLHVFQVQVGAFGQKANAERLIRQLSAQGLPVELVPAGNLIQVRTGMFFKRSTAEALRDRISTDGTQAMVVEKIIDEKELTYSTTDEDYYRFSQELAASLVQALTAAEEGRLETAAAKIDELLKTAKDITISNEKKEILLSMLQNINSDLVKAMKVPADQKTDAVSRGVNVFVSWYQREPGA